MISVDRPTMGAKDEKSIEVNRAKESLNRSDIEFIAAMAGVELDSMADDSVDGDEEVDEDE